jgi:hypothetical protein
MTADIRQRKPIVDTRIERQIVTGMIMSDRFLREVRPLCTQDALQADFARRVAGWCLDYYEKYKKSPKKHVEDLYLKHKAEAPEEESSLIEEFLGGISDEYEQSSGFNDGYVLDQAELYFRLTSLKSLQAKVKQSILSGSPEEGEELVKSYKRPARPKSQGVDPLRDMDVIVSALTPEENNPDVILKLPGDLGDAVGPLERGYFAAIQAESSVGKTWWLWWIAQLCVFSGYNTVFFSMEMTVLKMVKRLWQAVAGGLSSEVPQDQLDPNGELLVPVFDCLRNQMNECVRDVRTCKIGLISAVSPGQDGEEDVKRSQKRPVFRDAPGRYRPCTSCRGTAPFIPSSWWKRAGKRELLSPESAVQKWASLKRSGVIKRAGRFYLDEFPSGRYTMDDLRSRLNNLEYYDNLIPSVIITDYADKIKWSVKGDPRVSIWEIWDGHKSLAQEKHCLVVTASQSNTERSGRRVGHGTWGETQEKRHLLDVGIDLNQSDSDQGAGVMRVSIDKRRHGQMERSGEVMVLQQLAVGRPYVDSCRVPRKEEKT